MPNDEAYGVIANDTPLDTFIPDDFTDVGQGYVLANAYKHKLRYCEGLKWLVYRDGVWEPSETSAQGFSQRLTDLQILEAREISLTVALSQRASTGKLIPVDMSQEKDDAVKYLDYALSRRSTARISATLKEATPRLFIPTSALDNDPLILNTPDGEVRLDTGEITPHNPEHFITHIASCAPSDQGADIWKCFLEQISCNDKELQHFLKQIVGMAAIGKVYEERLIIAVGNGGNGKSTFFNAIRDVLGDYACSIRSELFISNNDSGKKFEYGNLRGKRFAVAEELEESKQLDTAAVKHLCSTGDINAQFKGKDIFTFKPTHTTVLCTNHMPSVKVIDNGTWDRLIVIPFNGRFRNTGNEVKNYGGYLVENCGGAILNWIIEGAQEYVRNDYKLIIPDCITQAMKQYQDDNDWMAEFFDKYLVIDGEQNAYGSDIYSAYEEYCRERGEIKQSMTTVLPMVASKANIVKRRSNKGILYPGIGIKSKDLSS